MQNNIPNTNINVTIVGCVSSGKSTLLNALFCENLAQMKMKRTTMVPCVFIENKDNDSINIKEISQNIESVNTTLIKKSVENKNVNYEDYKPLYFNVGKIDLKFDVKCNLTIYDIPGLNDSMTKHVYYNYLQENFVNFNIILFIVDINSGMNTDNEIEILQFIIAQTKTVTEKKIYTLVVINKVDDMQINNGKIEITGELNEMYDQIIHTVNSKFTENNIIDHLIGIIPICAFDAFLYRMILHKNTEYELTPENILKIGINEMGKKFMHFDKNKQKQKVNEIISNTQFLYDMIKLSGFGNFKKTLNQFLINNSNKLIIDNLIYEYNLLPSLRNIFMNMSFDNNLDSNLNNDDLDIAIIKYQQLLDSIKCYDEIKYNELKNIMINDIHCSIIKLIHKKNNTNDVILICNVIIRKLSNTFLSDTFQENYYFDYIITYIHSIIMDELKHGNNIDINHFMEQFNYLLMIKTPPNLIEECILLITTKSFNKQLIKFDNYSENNVLLFLESIKEYINNNNNIIKKLVKLFLLILIENNYDDDELCNFYYYCKLHNEIYISSYLLKKINFTFQNVIDDFDDTNVNAIEAYYIEIINEKS